MKQPPHLRSGGSGRRDRRLENVSPGDRREECPVYFHLPHFTPADVFVPTLSPPFSLSQACGPTAKAVPHAQSVWHNQARGNSKGEILGNVKCSQFSKSVFKKENTPKHEKDLLRAL